LKVLSFRLRRAFKKYERAHFCERGAWMVTATTDEYVAYVERERDAALRTASELRRQLDRERSESAADRRSLTVGHLEAQRHGQALLGAAERGSEGLRGLLRQAKRDAARLEDERRCAVSRAEQAERTVRRFREKLKGMSDAVMNGDQIDIENSLKDLKSIK